MIKVAVVEDNRVVRDALSARLNDQTDFTVCYSAANGSMEDLHDTAPEILLLDVGLEGDDSLHLAKRIRSEVPEVRVIVMDLVPVHEELVELIAAGVSGFILKDATLDEFLTTIRTVAGHPWPERGRLDHRAHIPGTECGRSDRRWVEQQVHRQAARHLPPHGEEPRSQHHGKAGASQPAPDRSPLPSADGRRRAGIVALVPRALTRLSDG
jgi:DNA-binding NarL/FixJ family response regulator